MACGSLSLGAYWLLSENSEKAPEGSFATSTYDLARQGVLKNIERPELISRQAWGAREVNHQAEEEFGFYTLDNPEGWHEYEVDLREAYQTVVIHHSSLYVTDDLTTVQEIQTLHMDDRGWADIGYHFCVGQNGMVYEGRMMSARGVHTEMYNTGSLGVCLLGNFEEMMPTQAQLDSTQGLLNWLVLRLHLSHLAGHRDFNSQTLCPGVNLYPRLDEFAAEAGLKRGVDGYIAPPEQLMTPSPEALSLIGHYGCSCGV